MRERRQARLQRVESEFEAIPVDSGVARAYGLIFAAVVSAGREARCPRVLDLLIAATALAQQIPLYTRNQADFAGLERLVEVVAI